MKKYIAWCCDYRKDTGEGLLARKFVKKYFIKKLSFSIFWNYNSLVLLLNRKKDYIY